MVVDGLAVPLACGTFSAPPAEVTLAEGVLDEVRPEQALKPLIAGGAYDSNLPRAQLLANG
jgi:hypothetical protein